MEQGNKEILILDKNGGDIRKIDLTEGSVFVIGDHDGLPQKELKKYKKRISIGPEIYFASQTFIIIHNELDRK